MVELLRKDGLIVNVPKTKVMVTVAQNRSDEQAELDQAEFSRDPLMIYDKPVEFVLTFPYLGTMLNSCGNWKAAWDHASQKAGFAYHNAVKGGVFYRAGSLSAMLDFARAIIWPHFDSLMVITGVGGADANAFYIVADVCIEKVLRSIAGYAMNVAALRIESGVWDTKTRAQMLLIRLHAKICSSDQHSLISRVVRMSMAALTDREYAAPAARWAFRNHVHKQSWAQQALAAADGLDMPKESVSKMAPGSLLDIQEERCVDGARIWEDVLDVEVYEPFGSVRSVLF